LAVTILAHAAAARNSKTVVPRNNFSLHLRFMWRFTLPSLQLLHDILFGASIVG
jgi:hypothetical protein